MLCSNVFALISPVFLCTAMVQAVGEDSMLPSGVRVSEGANPVCIEFSEDGQCFVSHGPFRFVKGTVEKTGEKLICRLGSEELQFSIRDGNLFDHTNTAWLIREKAIKPLKAGVSPLRIIVLDKETREPVSPFEYSYELTTDKERFSPLLARPVTVHSEDATFSLMTPEACEIRLEVSGRNVIDGFGSIQTHVVSKFNTERTLEVLVETGARVSGVVVDAATGEPIAEATVSPLIFTPPLFTPDDDRQMRTNARGEFTIYGVDASLGIHVAHDAYFEGEWNAPGNAAGIVYEGVAIEIKQGPSIAGTVTGPDGKPLGGVEVSDGSGKSATTKPDGHFVLLSPSAWGGGGKLQISFEKDGFLNSEHKLPAEGNDSLNVVMKPQPVLTGSIRSASGDRVPAFQVAVGCGKEPGTWRCDEADFEDSESFSIAVRTDRDYDNENCVWVGIKADGFALWETELPTWETRRSIEVILKQGVELTGHVSNRSRAQGRIEVGLLPRRLVDSMISGISQRQQMGRLSAFVNDQGDFKFANVAPGQYLLAIGGKFISPMSRLIEVADTDVALGSFSLQGTGTITGIAWKKPRDSSLEEGDQAPPSRQPFAEGYVQFSDSAGYSEDEEFPHLASISFKTDEAGRFRVENVPVGLVSVNLPYWASADILEADSLLTNVSEGQTTEVEFFSPARRENLRCRIVVGDGTEEHWETGTGLNAARKTSNVNSREPAFRISLRPVSGHGSSYPENDWLEASRSREMLLSDVGPGTYQVIVDDWMMSTGFTGELYRTRIDVGSEACDVQIPLGAGCRTGVIRWSKDFRQMVHIVARGDRTGTIRHAWCDDEGNFCLRYLPADTYQIFAHDSEAGWCRIPDTNVQDDSADLGTHTLASGGTLRVDLPITMMHDKNIRVMAVHENGLSPESLSGDDLQNSPVTFGQLWPGKWTVTVRNGETDLVQKTVQLQPEATVDVDLKE